MIVSAFAAGIFNGSCKLEPEQKPIYYNGCYTARSELFHSQRHCDLQYVMTMISLI